MTNKQERYFVVSEAELKNLAGVAAIYEVCEPDNEEACHADWEKAEAACRARPVPEWAEYFADVSDDSGSHQLVRYVRIKK